jgi:hypothetical protein
MTLIYPHWQTGRLVEGYLVDFRKGYVIEEMYISHAPVIPLIESLTGQRTLVNTTSPNSRYILSWFDEDNDIAYYNIATRCRA